MLSPLRAALLLGPPGRALAAASRRPPPALSLLSRQPSRRAAAAMATSASATPGGAGGEAGFRFGPWPIAADQVFYRTELSVAFVNLKPLVPGEVSSAA